jgi:hypothetical protein
MHDADVGSRPTESCETQSKEECGHFCQGRHGLSLLHLIIFTEPELGNKKSRASVATPGSIGLSAMIYKPASLE